MVPLGAWLIVYVPGGVVESWMAIVFPHFWDQCQHLLSSVNATYQRKDKVFPLTSSKGNSTKMKTERGTQIWFGANLPMSHDKKWKET